MDLGSGAHSSTIGGGANYQFTNNLSASAQATYYDQFYFGKTYTGTFLEWHGELRQEALQHVHLLRFGARQHNGQGNNAVGFVGNVNFFRRFRGLANVSPVQLRAERADAAGYLHNFLLQLQRECAPPIAATDELDGGFQRNHSGLTN